MASRDPEVEEIEHQVAAYNAELRLEKARIPDPREAWYLNYHDPAEYHRRLYGLQGGGLRLVDAPVKGLGWDESWYTRLRQEARQHGMTVKVHDGNVYFVWEHI